MDIRWTFLLALSTCLALACSGGDDDDPTAVATTALATATPALEASPTVAPTATPPPLPTPPGPGSAVPKTVWLVDIAAGASQALAEDYDSFAVSARFSPSGEQVHLTVGQKTTAHDLDGNEIGPAPSLGDCTYTEQAEQIEGRWHPALQCASAVAGAHPFLSPDGRWFTYRLEDAAATPVFPPSSEMWALNLDTGERHLLHEILECGGCDGRFVPSWSPSGRYYVFAETGGDGRVFLSDLEAQTTWHIAHGNEVSEKPHWGRDQDLLLYRSAAGATVLHDVASGTVEDLSDLAWPANFDPSGTHIYSPAFSSSPKEGATETTTIISLVDRQAVTFEGAPDWLNLWRPLSPLTGSPAVAAALVGAPGCDGTQIYRDTVAFTCIQGGQGATFSPDGTKVAVARVTGATGLVSFPGGGAVSLNIFEVVVVDLATGSESVVAKDAISDQAPYMVWNNGSSHLLVEWPAFGGL